MTDDLSWLDDDGKPDDAGGDEEEDLDAAAAKLTADNEEAEGEEGAGAEADAQVLLEFVKTRDDRDADADALFKQQLAEAERKSRDYVPPPEPLTPIEEAAVAAAQMSRDDLEFFQQQLRDAAAQRKRELRANQPGFDSAGDPVEPPPPPFDPSGLDAQGFDIFMDAAARGGANPSRTPSGWSKADWEKAVDSALGAGAER